MLWLSDRFASKNTFLTFQGVLVTCWYVLTVIFPWAWNSRFLILTDKTSTLSVICLLRQRLETLFTQTQCREHYLHSFCRTSLRSVLLTPLLCASTVEIDTATCIRSDLVSRSPQCVYQTHSCILSQESTLRGPVTESLCYQVTSEVGLS